VELFTMIIEIVLRKVSLDAQRAIVSIRGLVDFARTSLSPVAAYHGGILLSYFAAVPELLPEFEFVFRNLGHHPKHVVDVVVPAFIETLSPDVLQLVLDFMITNLQSDWANEDLCARFATSPDFLREQTFADGILEQIVQRGMPRSSLED
jgi:hypothetical protein